MAPTALPTSAAATPGPRSPRTRALLAGALAAALALPGCMHMDHENAALGRTCIPMHILADQSHPWHAYPAQVVGVPAAFLLVVATLPLSGLEWLITGEYPLQRTNPGYVLCGVGILGLGAGAVVGVPFFVLGLPFEDVQEEDPPAKPPVRAVPKEEAPSRPEE